MGKTNAQELFDKIQDGDVEGVKDAKMEGDEVVIEPEDGYIVISVAHPKSGNECKFLHHIGGSLAEAQDIYTDELIFDGFRRQLVIAAQGVGRALLDQGYEPAKVEEEMAEWTYGTKRKGTRKDSQKALLGQLEGDSVDEVIESLNKAREEMGLPPLEL